MTEGANHGTRWTKEEIAFLQSEWDGTFDTAAVIAEILGRTQDAVMQRHYELEWGSRTIEEAPVDKPEPGAPKPERVQVRVVRIETTFEVDPSRVCTTCWTVKSASGECFCG